MSRRAAAVLTAALTVLAVLLPAGSASAQGCATPAPTTAAGWQELVSDSVIAGRWWHGDSGQSVKLPDGRHLWVFSDTMSGTVGPAGEQNFGDLFIHNRALITDAGCASHLVGPGAPATDWIPITAGRDLPGVADYYWVSTPFMDGAVLRIFLWHVVNDPIQGFRVLGMDLASFSLASGTPVLTSIRATPAANAGTTMTPMWGAGVVRTTTYTYIFGSRLKAEPLVFGHYQYLARVPTGQLATNSAWRYWNGTGWGTSQTDVAAVAVIPGVEGVGSDYMVYPRQVGGWYLVAKQHGQFGTEIAAWTAPALTGPWTRTAVLVSPVPDVEGNEITYSAHAHPDVPVASGQLVITWARNDPDLADFGSPRYGVLFREVAHP